MSRRFEVPEKRGDPLSSGKPLIPRAEKPGFADELLADEADEAKTEKSRRRRLAWVQRGIAALITLPFAIWIALEGTGTYFPRYAWLLPLAGAYYLGLRIGGVAVNGWTRAREQRLEPPHEPLDD